MVEWDLKANKQQQQAERENRYCLAESIACQEIINDLGRSSLTACAIVSGAMYNLNDRYMRNDTLSPSVIRKEATEITNRFIQTGGVNGVRERVRSGTTAQLGLPVDDLEVTRAVIGMSHGDSGLDYEDLKTRVCSAINKSMLAVAKMNPASVKTQEEFARLCEIATAMEVSNMPSGAPLLATSFLLPLASKLPITHVSLQSAIEDFTPDLGDAGPEEFNEYIDKFSIMLHSALQEAGTPMRTTELPGRR